MRIESSRRSVWRASLEGSGRVVVALCLLFGAFMARAEDALTFEDDILPIVGTYCVGCHNDVEREGDLDLLRFETLDMALDSLAIWQRIGKRLEAKEMPPRKKLQPSDEEKKKLIAWIASLKIDDADCNRIASEESAAWYPGYVMSRRINRAEYENTISDLLGVEIETAHLFPADGAGGEGFNNTGNALFLSTIQLEKYLEAAELSMDTVFPIELERSRLAGVGRFLGRAVTFRWTKSAEQKRLAEAQSRIIFARPGSGLEAREAASQVVENFATRAWRRPLDEDELDRLLAMFDRGFERGDGYEPSLKLAFKAVLLSPNFLFLAEREPDAAGVYELGDYALAARLSYFLWSTMPDVELLDLARAGELRSTETLRLQTRRMLRDPKAAALGENFATQWLGIERLGGATGPDADRFPEFDERLADSMRGEAVLFFNRVVQEDRALLELIDADYTFADERLAELYGLPGVRGDEMRVVELADSGRGGVLGMAAVLTATSHPLRTSPVLRGKWVLEQVLGDRVPPPPANVASLPEDDVQDDGLSFRKRMEAHRKKPECASCHQRMDPIGFGLENFDPIGRWRNLQGGQPVDAAGELPSGETFEGPSELKKIILKRKDDFVGNISRKMLGYALGRSLTRYDDCVVDAAVEALQADGYRSSNLFEQIVLSTPFRHRYSRK